MTTLKYNHAIIKVWFTGGHISRTFARVVEIQQDGDLMLIRNNSNTTYRLNWANVNMIEEVHDE